MPKKSKQNEGLKAYKKTRQQNRVNSILWAKVRITNGVPREDIITGMMERYGFARSTAEHNYNHAASIITTNTVRDAETIINKNLQRLDAIAEAAADGDDYTNAIKAIDTLNKMSGAYVEKKEVQIEGANIKFEFDGNAEDGL